MLKSTADSSNIRPEALKYVDAYLEGINYFIKTGPKTIEHQIIGAKVRPFDRVDVASMTIYMAFSFMDGMRRDMIYSMIKQQISTKNLDYFFLIMQIKIILLFKKLIQIPLKKIL